MRWLALLLGIAVCALLGSVAVGAAGLSLSEVVTALAGGGEATTRTIVWQLRLPRAVLALIAGGALASSGAVFQALLRNPLAEPYILGVAGGAGVGAVAAVVLGATGATAALVPAAALAGALLAILLVFRIATRAQGSVDTRVLLLAGVVAGSFFNAVILVLLTFADAESFRSAVFWMMGSLAGASWRSSALLALYVVPTFIVLGLLARPLNAIAVGEETAHHLGVRVERVKLTAYILASLGVAAAVAACGVIGFIGLVVPHAIRLIWGSDHRFLLPASVLAGGTFLLLADTAARTILPPAELPVGVITALVGVPLFVLLLRRRGW